MAAESDGYGKYEAPDPEETKSRLIAEKVREDRLRRHLDRFARWDWKAAIRAEPLDAILSRAGLDRIAPRQYEMLATLRRHPRSFPSHTPGFPSSTR